MKTIIYNGKKYPVENENGKYYFCKGAQFRRLNPGIKVVETEKRKGKEHSYDLHSDGE